MRRGLRSVKLLPTRRRTKTDQGAEFFALLANHTALSKAIERRDTQRLPRELDCTAFCDLVCHERDTLKH